eukprot:COSAG01_NODE_778_length_13681_cov_15.265130_3_plen_97_part_00
MTASCAGRLSPSTCPGQLRCLNDALCPPFQYQLTGILLHSLAACQISSQAHYCNIIEAPWLVNGGHGASLRHHNIRTEAMVHAAAIEPTIGTMVAP